MLFKKQKILCYVMIFDQVDIIRKCVDFLAHHADRLDIVIVENPSNNTPEISKYINALGKQGKVARYYLFDENITNNALHKVFETEMDLIRSNKYVIISDGDIVSDDKGWLNEEIRIMDKHPEVFTVGITFDTSNLPLKTFPNAKDWLGADKAVHKDYIEAVTGTHLEILRGKEFYDLLLWKDANKIHLVDGSMHKYCEEVLHKKWARTKKAKGYHLTWDLYNDINHPYTKLKLSKSFGDTWLHKRTAGYELTDYAV